MFKKNIKIRKGVAVGLILKAVNPRDVAYTFLAYARKIHARLTPADPNFARWCVELARIEQWCETYYPGFVASEGGSDDVRADGLKQWSEKRRTQALIMKHAKLEGRDPTSMDAKEAIEAAKRSALDPRDLMTEDEKKALDKKDRDEMMKFFILMLAGMTLFMGIVALATWEIIWYWTMDTPDPLSTSVVQLYHIPPGRRAMQPWSRSSPPCARASSMSGNTASTPTRTPNSNSKPTLAAFVSGNAKKKKFYCTSL